MSNRGEEDYIKNIYSLAIRENDSKTARISNQQLCHRFSHSIQSVNEMIKRLEKKGWVDYKPYKGSTLTSAGIDMAERLIRNHRLWEVFLTQYCEYELEEIHDEAERLEHVTSEKLAKALNRFMSEPDRCPHGSIIPKIDKE